MNKEVLNSFEKFALEAQGLITTTTTHAGRLEAGRGKANQEFRIVPDTLINEGL
jgi:hypothetical protein